MAIAAFASVGRFKALCSLYMGNNLWVVMKPVKVSVDLGVTYSYPPQPYPVPSLTPLYLGTVTLEMWSAKDGDDLFWLVDGQPFYYGSSSARELSFKDALNKYLVPTRAHVMPVIVASDYSVSFDEPGYLTDQSVSAVTPGVTTVILTLRGNVIVWSDGGISDYDDLAGNGYVNAP